MHNSRMRHYVAITLALTLLGCGEASQVMQAEFSSMEECRAIVRSSTGLALDPMTDRPDKVIGFLGSTKWNFALTQETSGTKGTYVEGWYDVDKDAQKPIASASAPAAKSEGTPMQFRLTRRRSISSLNGAAFIAADHCHKKGWNERHHSFSERVRLLSSHCPLLGDRGFH